MHEVCLGARGGRVAYNGGNDRFALCTTTSPPSENERLSILVFLKRHHTT